MTPRPEAAPAAIAAQALALRARPSRRQPRRAIQPGNQATSTPTTTDARRGHFKPSRRGQCKPSFPRPRPGGNRGGVREARHVAARTAAHSRLNDTSTAAAGQRPRPSSPTRVGTHRHRQATRRASVGKRVTNTISPHRARFPCAVGRVARRDGCFRADVGHQDRSAAKWARRDHPTARLLFGTQTAALIGGCCVNHSDTHWPSERGRRRPITDVNEPLLPIAGRHACHQHVLSHRPIDAPSF